MPRRARNGPYSDSLLVRRRLLAWFRAQRRALPWRGTRDPYRIWVSEVMLQQTTVKAVLPRYEKFLRRFPDLASLARAREESVLAEWSGLGYYSRARNLRRAAVRIAREHGGRLPRDARTLRRLPGFGDYTAAAVASLAFGRREPAADVNVTRVISRLWAIDALAGTAEHGETVRAAAAELLPRNDPGRVTAALMDLGQAICLPRQPACAHCPLRQDCAAYRRGCPESYPRRRRTPRPVRVSYAAACIFDAGRVLLQRGETRLLRGMWTFPGAAADSPEAARRRLRAELRRFGARLSRGPRLGTASHTMVNRRLTIEVFSATLEPSLPPSETPAGSHRWFDPRGLSRAPLPTLTRKIGAAAGFLPEASGVS